MSKLPILEHFLSVGNLKPKLELFFKPKHKLKFVPLNWAPVALVGGFCYHRRFVLSEERLDIDGHNLYIEKILGGTTRMHAREICNSRGMELFEPRDSTVNHVVWKKARGFHRWSWGYWLNVRRVDPETMVFKYATNDTEVVSWSNWKLNEPENKIRGSCATSNHGGWGYKWEAHDCDDRANVICQDGRLEVAREAIQ